MSVTQLKDKHGRPTGRALVVFRVPGLGPRKLVVDLDRAPQAERMIRGLIAAKRHGHPLDSKVRAWIAGLTRRQRQSLAGHGLIPPEVLAARKLATEFLAEYVATMRARGVTEAHVTLSEARIRRALDGTHALHVGQLDAGRVTDYLAGLQVSPTTRNHHQTALSGFTAWLVREGHLDRDPLVRVPRVAENGEDGRLRRALTHDEQARLLEATRKGTLWRPKHRNGMTVGAEDRWMLYQIALVTGLRASELRSLTRASFDLQGNPPTVTVRSGSTKNRLEACLPLRADTAVALAGYLEGKLPAARALRVPRWTAEMLRHDLEAAGIPYETDAGVVDFHALRHTFITNLTRAGVHPRLAQQLARHADINLTMRVYTHTLLSELAAGIEALPGCEPKLRCATKFS